MTGNSVWDESPLRQFPPFEQSDIFDSQVHLHEWSEYPTPPNISQDNSPFSDLEKSHSNTQPQIRKTFKKITKADKSKIFTRVSPKRSQNGNKNFSKFLIKLFFKSTQKANKGSGAYQRYLAAIKREIYAKNSKTHNRQDLMKITSPVGITSEQFASNNRQMFSSILSYENQISGEIIENNFIKKKPNKKQYLLACKIFRLRCRNKTLSSRLPSR